MSDSYKLDLILRSVHVLLQDKVNCLKCSHSSDLLIPVADELLKEIDSELKS